MKAIQRVLVSILVIALSSFAEDDDDESSPIGAVYTKEGVTVFSNFENDFFTFEIRGKNPHAFQKGRNFFVNVNDKGFQYNVVSLSGFLSPEEMKNKNDSAVLRKHMNFELKYFEAEVKTRLDVKAENKKSRNGRMILVWSFAMPKQDGNVKKQLIVSTMTKSHVLVLNGIIIKEKDYKETCKILENAMNSLRLQETAIHPEALQVSLKQKK